MNKILLISAVVVCLTGYAAAQAPCPESCPDGQVLVTFGDGNNLTCACVEQGDGMVEGPVGCDGSDCDAPNEVSEQD